MAIENDFLPFAAAAGANVLTQAQYAALGPVIQNGFSSGTAQSTQLNKVWRQSSIIAAMLAQFIVDQTGQPAIDNGTTATLESNLIQAIKNVALSQFQSNLTTSGFIKFPTSHIFQWGLTPNIAAGTI